MAGVDDKLGFLLLLRLRLRLLRLSAPGYHLELQKSARGHAWH
jgi:hypothetical protein